MSNFDDFMIGEVVEKNQELDRLRQSNRAMLKCLKEFIRWWDSDEDESHFTAEFMENVQASRDAIKEAENKS